MMYGREKSNFAIVVVKLANKAEQSAAELVEPRAEIKGNAGWQSTYRAGLACHRRWTACGKHLPFGPEVGAVCGKAARTDLCGGCEVTRIPTATSHLLRCMSSR
jgi:hypothetical protein